MPSIAPGRSGRDRRRVGPARGFVAPLALTLGLTAYDIPHEDPIRRVAVADPTLDGAAHVAGAGKSGWASKSKNIALGDLDGDGDLDVVTQTGYLSAVWVLLNDGNGGLPVRSHYDLGGSVISVALGDMDADGDLDIVAQVDDHVTRARIAILPNEGDGSFLEPQRPYSGDLSPAAFALGDLDRDGHLDLVVKAMTEDGYDAVLVLSGEGGGRFAMRAQYELVATTLGMNQGGGRSGSATVVLDR